MLSCQLATAQPALYTVCCGTLLSSNLGNVCIFTANKSTHKSAYESLYRLAPTSAFLLLLPLLLLLLLLLLGLHCS
jgi:hypothetical protein